MTIACFDILLSWLFITFIFNAAEVLPLIPRIVVVTHFVVDLNLWAGRVISSGKTRNAYKIFIGKLEGKIPLGDLGADYCII
jgi:hypothetical protein